MELFGVFHLAAKTAFTVFKSLQRDGIYILNPDESGWTDSEAPTQVSMKIIPLSLSDEQVRNSKFFAKIKPTDTVVMVLGSDIISNNIKVRSGDSFSIVQRTSTQLYGIEDFDTDPAEALYLLLLREVV